MSCGFESNNHVAYFVQSLKRNTSLRSTAAITCSGLQSNGVYAMNANCFISKWSLIVVWLGLIEKCLLRVIRSFLRISYQL